MSDLVRRDFDDELAHQFLLDGRRPPSTRLQHADAKRGLLRQAVGVIAIAAAVTAPPRRQRKLRPLRGRQHRRHKFLSGAAHRADDAFAETDVGIVNLAGERIRPGRADGECRAHAGEPANRVVTRVGRVPIRVIRHLIDDDGVLEPDLFECLVPEQHPLLHPVPVFNRDGVFEPENDRLFRRRERCRRIGFLQLPAMDVTHVR